MPFLDYQLFRHPENARIALNIGGIANITVIPANAKPEDVIAFDTGPGNMVMDAVAPPFDRDGERARAGQVNAALLEQLLADPYYRSRPSEVLRPRAVWRRVRPRDRHRHRNCHRADRPDHRARDRALSGNARSDCFRRRRAQRIFDGTHGALVRARVAASVTTSAEFGIGVDAKEAILFAVLAYQTFHRRAGNLPSATGARKPVILGKISRGTMPFRMRRMIRGDVDVLHQMRHRASRARQVLLRLRRGDGDGRGVRSTAS